MYTCDNVIELFDTDVNNFQKILRNSVDGIANMLYRNITKC